MHGRKDALKQIDKKRPEIPQEIVAASAQNGENGIAAQPIEGATRMVAVTLYVYNLVIDGTSASERIPKFGLKTASGSLDQNAIGLCSMATIAAIGNRVCGTLIGQDFYLFQDFCQHVPIIGIAQDGAYAHHEALLVCGGNAGLGAKLVPDRDFTFLDAVDVRFMQSVDFTISLLRLLQQTRD